MMGVSTMTKMPMPDIHGDEDDVSLEDMLATGATYRQIDYWVRVGYLNPGNHAPGSGGVRRWSVRDLWMAYLMVRLGESGIGLVVAYRMASQAVDHDVWTYETPSGVTIEWKVSE